MERDKKKVEKVEVVEKVEQKLKLLEKWNRVE